jgi:uncharacterized protein (TIGR03435 family)
MMPGRIAIVIGAAVSVCCAQGSEQFDVASVKQSVAEPGSRGMSGPTPGGFTGVNAPLRLYISFAYNVRSDQVFGPDWIDSGRFDIVAKKDGQNSLDGTRAMMRNLLAERFRLVAHRETRDVPVYALTVGKDGAKHLVKATADEEESVRPLPLGRGKGRRFQFRGVTMAYLSFFLGKLVPLDRLSVDLTGIQGRFDFDLDIPDRDAQTEPMDYQISVVFPAVFAQLGLKVEARKAPVEVVAIDSALRVPTAN